MKKNYHVIEVPSSGKPTWYGGAYTLAYLYSKKGNFLVKGYQLEVEKYIKSHFDHYFVRYTLWHDKKSREIIEFWKKDVSIVKPQNKKGEYYDPERFHRWLIQKSNGDFRNYQVLYQKTFKRLPMRWIPEFDQL